MLTFSSVRQIMAAFYICLFTHSVQALASEPLVLQAGVWEGIESSRLHYRILQISDGDTHQFHSVAISSALTKGRVYSFTNDDIRCSSTECIIQFVSTDDNQIRLIITPYLDSSYRVLEIGIGDNQQLFLPSTYQLDSMKNGSAVKNFLDYYDQAKIKSLSDLNSDTELYGLWIGRLVIDDIPQLLSFAVFPDKESNFTLHINGENYVNRTTFMTNDISKNEDLITIHTSHPTFANRLIIHRLNNSQIRGHMYSVINGQTLQTGGFWLLRVE